MEIIIKDKNAYRTSVEAGLVFWQMYSIRNRWIYIIQFGIALAFLLLGAFITDTSGVDHTQHDWWNLNGVQALGIAYIFTNTVSMFKFNAAKKKIMEYSEKTRRVMFGKLNESTTIINDEGVSIETPVARSEHKWVLFLNHSFHKDYLILNMGERIEDGIFLDKRPLSPEALEELLHFIRKRLPERKN